MALSVLDDRSHEPTEQDLRRVLGEAYEPWSRLIAAVGERIAPLAPLWAYTGASAGWGLRLVHRKRVILYMTPQSGQFLVSFALGEKAVAAAKGRRLPAALLKSIDAAPRYAEGRGLRLEVSRNSQVPPLAALAQVKREN